MSNLINYLPCPKCFVHSANIMQMENKGEELFLKLNCSNFCSVNYLKFSELKKILNNQTKVGLNMFVHGNFNKEQEQIENISTKLINKINNIYLSIENIEKEIIKLKEELKSEIAQCKRILEDFQLLHKLIYGAYLKKEEKISEDNNKINFNNNLKYININGIDNYSINNNFYYQEMEKDIIEINNSIKSIKKEIYFYLKNNINIFTKENENNKSLSPLVGLSNIYSSKKTQKHNYIETYSISIKNIESIVLLSDGNIALGSLDEMIIYNLELQKEIMNIPGDFSDIKELKYNKLNRNNSNNKTIIILSVQSKRIKIYDIYNNKILLNYSQYYNIDNTLELYNGDVLYICDYNIYNISLKEEFKIYLKYYCYAMINFYNEQNILGFSCLSKINLVNLDKPKKVFKEIEVVGSKEIYDIKEIYEEKTNDNYLIILSDKFLNLYDLTSSQFKYTLILKNIGICKNLFITKNNYNDHININIIGYDSAELFHKKDDQFIHVLSINSLKNTKSAFIYNKKTTPFSINNEGKYLLIFNCNEEGFNAL